MKPGFTLIEVMLAVGITAIVGSLIYGGFDQTARNRARLETDLDHNRAVHLTLERLARELSMAYVSAQLNPSVALQEVKTAFVGTDRGDEDRIDFNSFSHQRLYRNTHESDQNELSYFLARDPDDSGKKVLARREQHRVDDDPRRGGKVQILLDNVVGFDVEYFDAQNFQWLRTWDTTQTTGQPNRLPGQVKISLVVRDELRGNREERFVTRASLPITYGLNHASYKP